jgi:alpha-L-rhamnosidase
MAAARTLLEGLLSRPDLPVVFECIKTYLEKEAHRRQAFREWLDEDKKAEFINGEVFLHSSVKNSHLAVSEKLSCLLLPFVRMHKLGRIMIEKALVALSRNDYEPDIAFFGNDKARYFHDDQIIFPAPDFIVEILSKSTAKNDRGIKKTDYAAHGVREYWIIDPGRQTLEQFLRIENDTEFMPPNKLLPGQVVKSVVLEGFEIPVETLFDEAVCTKTLARLTTKVNKWSVFSLKNIISVLFIVMLQVTAFCQDIQLIALQCEHRTNPSGIEAAQPRLSWNISTAERGWTQSAWQIQVARKSDFSVRSLVWDSQKVASDDNILQAYRGGPLLSGQRYYWRVRVWDGSDRVSAWSAPAFWEMGLLQRSDWKARWTEPEGDSVRRFEPASLLRKEFSLKKKIARARAYVTARGMYELWINGQRVGDELLTPGWTMYFKRLQYQTYDVTAHLRSGQNAVGAMLGEGWFRSRMGWRPVSIYGKKLALLCQINVEYTDGSTEILLSDETWKATNTGPVRKNEIYFGEMYDARMEIPGWNMPGFDDRHWRSCSTADHSFDVLTASESVPVRAVNTLPVQRIWHTPQGTLVADFGQNLVGWVRLKVRGPVGTVVKIRHAEVLDKAGNFYTDNLRAAEQLAVYTLKGAGEEIFEPHFTFMGFRYAAIEGFPGELQPEHLEAVVVHSDMQPTGTFECSHPLLNQLQRNIQWGQKGNFVDIPTDCPQRDERLGWTGDAQVFAATAAYNMDVSAFFAKWLRDMAAEQRPDGTVPVVIPDVLNAPGSATAQVSAGWSDAMVMIPWEMYQIYGDRAYLERHYEAMKAWVESMNKKAGEEHILYKGSMYGDWLFYRPAPSNASEPDAYTNRDFISTAFFAHSTRLLAQSARLLGKEADAIHYERLFESIRAAFLNEYVTATGRTASDSQTSYVLCLMFDLLPEALRPKAVRYLTEDIKARKMHLSTGFLGTPYLNEVLTQNGQTEMAYELLLQETYPSWLFPVKMGATTIWERWDGIKADSTFQDKGMNSFNHYAYGAIGNWMYQTVAGLRPDAPGYKTLRIAPELTQKLSYAKATLQTPYGYASSHWERKDGSIILAVTIPANTRATVLLPQATASEVTESGRRWQGEAVQQAHKVAIQTGSGSYVFVWKETQ